MTISGQQNDFIVWKYSLLFLKFNYCLRSAKRYTNICNICRSIETYLYIQASAVAWKRNEESLAYLLMEFYVNIVCCQPLDGDTWFVKQGEKLRKPPSNCNDTDNWQAFALFVKVTYSFSRLCNVTFYTNRLEKVLVPYNKWPSH